jgi:hypothetical protein
LLERFAAAADCVDEALFERGCPDDLLALQQRLHREFESRLARLEPARRRAFTIVVPVADRPLHLQDCLASLLTLCESFGYGGVENGRFRKVGVLIADDSREPENIQRHRELAEAFTRQGLEVQYFGQAEQLRQLEALRAEQRQALQPVLGDVDPQAFYHKGASITRNLAYLKLAEQARTDPGRLFWFLDSDQEFCVNIPERAGPVYAIDYLGRLDEVFSRADTRVLTGKVVGDPPVSPAVMGGNFLADVHAFVAEMAGLDPRQRCSFHQSAAAAGDRAAYHDMADLFGFKPADPARYPCSIAGAHEHVRCFIDFAARLNRFFDGEHPTRRSHYTPQAFQGTIKPARTVYTGNYVLSAEALQYFIPFATLKLRMAGPVLGRLLQTGLGGRFVSANLPLLHKRTLESLGQAEFRSGIQREAQRVDLSAEFERQFYGDVMLFTVEQLCRQGYPEAAPGEAVVAEVLAQTEDRLRLRYAAKQDQIGAGLDALRTLFGDPRQWWHREPACAPAVAEFERFISNMADNFGAEAGALRQIRSAGHRRRRLQQLLDAILHLPQDRSAWRDTLAIDH